MRAIEGQLEYGKRNNNGKCDIEYIAKEMKTENKVHYNQELRRENERFLGSCICDSRSLVA